MSAIKGLDVIYGETTAPPAGYNKIPADLNSGAGGSYVYLCYSTSVHGQPITSIQVFAGDSADFPTQGGYTVIRKDLNKGAGGKYIYVCYSVNSALGHHIKGVDVVQGQSQAVYPAREDQIRIDQDCSEGAGGLYGYVVYNY